MAVSVKSVKSDVSEVVDYIADMFSGLHKSLQLHDVRIHGLNEQIDKLRGYAQALQEEVKPDDSKDKTKVTI